MMEIILVERHFRAYMSDSDQKTKQKENAHHMG